MNIDEVKEVVERIIAKQERVKKLEALKLYIDDRTHDGNVTLSLERESFDIDANALKGLVTAQIQSQDTAQDEAELKQKAK